ncbi:MAG: hypothetical protein IPP96_02150 [Chitinophagaceae bacterium]|nr:hypothetical protein [Chitinophagaceae bacterium]
MENTELIRLLNKELSIDLVDRLSSDEIHAQLSNAVNQLVKNNFEKLVSLLYRIDVSEQKLKSLLHQFPQEDAGNIIASLIIERQEQKLKTRKHSDNDRNSQRDDDLDEEEKW